ncbi:MAG: hypothetical protein NWE78_07335 [Candidatus Bathyarchaeota archaeon]|nr:hypothetical protein [Candidatus Bathyarchaeota archaeon]
MFKKHWWQRSKAKAIFVRRSWYKLNCPYCRISFYIDEDLPLKIQPSEEWWDEEEEIGGYRDFYGLMVFEVFCPACGQILRFDRKQTPVGRLSWRRLRKASLPR